MQCTKIPSLVLCLLKGWQVYFLRKGSKKCLNLSSVAIKELTPLYLYCRNTDGKSYRLALLVGHQYCQENPIPPKTLLAKCHKKKNIYVIQCTNVITFEYLLQTKYQSQNLIRILYHRGVSWYRTPSTVVYRKTKRSFMLPVRDHNQKPLKIHLPYTAVHRVTP